METIDCAIGHQDRKITVFERCPQIFVPKPWQKRIRLYCWDESSHDRAQHQPDQHPSRDRGHHDLILLAIALHFIRDLIRTRQEVTREPK
jgi:hypothetical protein